MEKTTLEDKAGSEEFGSLYDHDTAILAKLGYKQVQIADTVPLHSANKWLHGPFPPSRSQPPTFETAERELSPLYNAA